jgi:hypothetical protein
MLFALHPRDTIAQVLPSQLKTGMTRASVRVAGAGVIHVEIFHVFVPLFVLFAHPDVNAIQSKTHGIITHHTYHIMQLAISLTLGHCTQNTEAHAREGHTRSAGEHSACADPVCLRRLATSRSGRLMASLPSSAP